MLHLVSQLYIFHYLPKFKLEEAFCTGSFLWAVTLYNLFPVSQEEQLKLRGKKVQVFDTVCFYTLAPASEH